MKKIAFIAVNYEGAEHTENFVRSLYSLNGVGLNFSAEIIIVDNSISSVGRSALVSAMAEFPAVTVLSQAENRGYFGALNVGLEVLQERQHEFDFIVIGNNDLCFEVSFVKELFELTIDDDLFALCPDVITLDRQHQNPHLRNKMSSLRKLKLDIYFSYWPVGWLMQYANRFLKRRRIDHCDEPCEIHLGIGACYVLTRNFFRENSLLNYPFFLYGEEAYFSDQVHRTGGKLVYCPTLIVHHAESAATSRLPNKQTYLFGREGYRHYRDLL